MVTETEGLELKRKFENGEQMSAEEVDALLEYSLAKAKADLAANPAHVKCKHCGGDVEIADIDIALSCPYCGSAVAFEDYVEGALPMPS